MSDLSFFQKPIADLTYADVERLVKDRTPESHILDYKQTNYTDSAELSKDICAFANTNGGYLILGVAEEIKNKKATGIPREIVGIQDDPNLVKRLCDMIINSVSSRPLVSFSPPIKIDNSERVVLVIYTPKSFDTLHMVMVKGKHQFRYYKRYHDQNVPMDEYEVRTKYEAIGKGQESTRKLLVEKAEQTYSRLSGKNPPALIFGMAPMLFSSKFDRLEIARSFDDSKSNRRIVDLFVRNSGINQTDIKMDCYEKTDDRADPCVALRYHLDGLLVYCTKNIFRQNESGKIISAGELGYQIFHLLDFCLKYFQMYEYHGYVMLYVEIRGLPNSNFYFPECQRTDWYSFNNGAQFVFASQYPDFWHTTDIISLASKEKMHLIADDCILPLFREAGFSQTKNLWDLAGNPAYDRHH